MLNYVKKIRDASNKIIQTGKQKSQLNALHTMYYYQMIFFTLLCIQRKSLTHTAEPATPKFHDYEI